MFKQAIKFDAKLRLALCGPAGSGKTYTLLSLATELAGPGGKIAYVDTEHGSASKYADKFTFDVIEPDQFDPRELIKTIHFAVANGYKVICCDSLSHYWMGKGGELELVDAAAKRSQSGNSFTAWKNVTPIHNELVDTIIGAKIHVLVSMRTKTEWVIEENDRGKKTPRKIGLAPIMRDGIEFEFDVCGDLDQDNTLTITKSRCSDLAGKVINRPGKPMAETLKKWLTGSVPVEPVKPAPAPAAELEAPPAPFVPSDDDIPGNMGGAWVDPQTEPSATARLESARKPAPEKPWTTFKDMLTKFAAMRSALGDAIYYSELDLAGVKHSNEFAKTKNPSADALACYWSLSARLDEFAAAAAGREEAA